MAKLFLQFTTFSVKQKGRNFSHTFSVKLLVFLKKTWMNEWTRKRGGKGGTSRIKIRWECCDPGSGTTVTGSNRAYMQSR